MSGKTTKTQPYTPSPMPTQFNYGDWNVHLRVGMLSRGIIPIIGTIGQDISSSGIVTEMMMSPLKPVVLLNSFGGSVHDSFAIYDIIKKLECDVVVSGLAASAASMIVLQAGKTRIAYPNARFMLHEAGLFVFGVEKTTEAKDRAREMKKVQDQVLKVLSGRTGKTVQEINRLIARKELWMSAEEALEWKLIDKIEVPWG